MHPAATDMIVKEVRQRISEGDCPSIRARSTEALEGAIEDLAGRLDLALKGEPAHHDRGSYESRHPGNAIREIMRAVSGLPGPYDAEDPELLQVRTDELEAILEDKLRSIAP